MEKFYREVKSFVLAGAFGLGVGLVVLSFSETNVLTAAVGIGTCVGTVIIAYLLARVGHHIAERITGESRPKVDVSVKGVSKKCFKILRENAHIILLGFLVGAFLYQSGTLRYYQKIPSSFKGIEFGSEIEGNPDLIHLMDFDDGSEGWIKVGFGSNLYEGFEVDHIFYLSTDEGKFCAAMVRLKSHFDYLTLLRKFNDKYGEGKKFNSGVFATRYKWKGGSTLVLESEWGDRFMVYHYKGVKLDKVMKYPEKEEKKIPYWMDPRSGPRWTI